MKKLNKLVKQLTDESYPRLKEELITAGAEKSARLLELAYEHQMSDHQALNELNIQPNAFYALKFRLNQKIQQFLLDQLNLPQVELTRRVNMIPYILENYPPDIAESTLQKLNKELAAYDMPFEQLKVLKALKHMNFHLPKAFYEYSTAYNLSLAYAIDADKVEDLLADFVLQYGYFFLNRTAEPLDRIHVLEAEISKLTRLYPSSPRLQLYDVLARLFSCLFIQRYSNKPLPEASVVEALLQSFRQLLDRNQLDSSREYYEPVYQLFCYEWARVQKNNHQLSLLDDELMLKIQLLLTRYHHVVFMPQFLESRLLNAQRLYKAHLLHVQNERAQLQPLEVSSEYMAAFYVYHRYLAACAFLAGKYQDALRVLITVRNQSEVRRHEFADMELKLFMALLYVLLDEVELARQFINSARRLNKDFLQGSLPAVATFCKLLVMSLRNEALPRKKHIEFLTSEFYAQNKGSLQVLTFLPPESELFDLLLPVQKSPVTRRDG
jgi:hypothetical protein